MAIFLAQTILNTTVKKTTDMKEKDKDVKKTLQYRWDQVKICENRTEKIRKKIVVAIGKN